MAVYKLYLESGPRHRKTMVHVLELLGCVATGPTTEEALSRTPRAIRDYLLFLERHGEIIGVDTLVETEVTEHVTEGVWLGNGDPSILYQPDLEPLTPDDAEVFIHRLLWMHAEVASLVGGLSEEDWAIRPQPSGRSIKAILEHVLESEYAYMRAFGKLDGLPGLGSIATKREGGLLEWTAHVRGRHADRIRSLNWKERSEQFIHWKQPRTARKVVRRMLEHQWEHLMELWERIGRPG